MILLEGPDGYVIYGDASRVDLGCMLMKQCRVVTFSSTKLMVNEKDNPTHDLDLAAVIFTVMIWRLYLYNFHVDMATYHKSLQYVFTQKELNIRLRR